MGWLEGRSNMVNIAGPATRNTSLSCAIHRCIIPANPNSRICGGFKASVVRAAHEQFTQSWSRL